MNTLVVQLDEKKSRIIASLAKELGGKVYDLSNERIVDFALGELMNSVKTNELVSKEQILEKLHKKSD